jgi:hypothetical protein
MIWCNKLECFDFWNNIISVSVSSVHQFVCTSLCLSVSLSLCLFVSLSLCLSVFLSLCLSVSLSRCVTVSLSRCVTVSLSRCVTVSLSRCVTVSLFLSLRLPSLSVCLSVSLYVYLPTCLSLSSFWRFNYSLIITITRIIDKLLTDSNRLQNALAFYTKL